VIASAFGDGFTWFGLTFPGVDGFWVGVILGDVEAGFLFGCCPGVFVDALTWFLPTFPAAFVTCPVGLFCCVGLDGFCAGVALCVIVPEFVLGCWPGVFVDALTWF